MNDQDRRSAAFGDLLLAGMKDAALEGKLTQLKAMFVPEGTSRAVFVRIIVIPEQMAFESADPKGFKSPEVAS